jgi:hypothetical protein
LGAVVSRRGSCNYSFHHLSLDGQTWQTNPEETAVTVPDKAKDESKKFHGLHSHFGAPCATENADNPHPMLKCRPNSLKAKLNAENLYHFHGSFEKRCRFVGTMQSLLE